ncbi:MAG: galactonate dehydratase [Rhodospirillaceae bacterium]|nr:galactonate dehydratase [Rhodospirillaceae bacterium]
MKITGIRTVVVNAEMRNWVFVKVETDQDGLYGWGEATLEWKTRAVVGCVQDLEPLMIGRDPRDIENGVRAMTKHGFWKLGVIGRSAIAGIEQAMWDIFGKSVGLPVWRLLGGKTREHVPVYTHLGMGNMNAVYDQKERSQLQDLVAQIKSKGYNAFKVLFPFYMAYTLDPRSMASVDGWMRTLREAAGEATEIMVDFHGKCASVALAVQCIEMLAPYRPMFAEEPVQPGDALAMKQISERTKVPIATGERLIDRRDFEELCQLRAITIMQPDLCHCGGIWEGRKIAAMGETAMMGVAPHNPLGPIAGVSALHFDIATPNVIIQEEMVGAVPWYGEVVQGPIRMVNGSWQIPTAPGLGVEVDERVAAKHPFKQEIIHSVEAKLADGTIVDW